tara:strand:- start:1143 stop:1334 length:192 start_codon:yes stop_codon:yes gene_type:complete
MKKRRTTPQRIADLSIELNKAYELQAQQMFNDELFNAIELDIDSLKDEIDALKTLTVVSMSEE